MSILRIELQKDYDIVAREDTVIIVLSKRQPMQPPDDRVPPTALRFPVYNFNAMLLQSIVDDWMRENA